MKDGKTVSERMREYVAMVLASEDCPANAVSGSEDVGMLRAMLSWADEIEMEIEAARQAFKWEEGFKVYAAEYLGQPMEDGESVLMWLKRNYIAIPADKEGEPWAIGDVCRLKDSDLPGDVFGYEVSVYGQVLVEVLVGTNLMAYDASALSRIEHDTQERIDDDAIMAPGAYCAERGIDIGADPDRETATTAMVRDLLRRQRELDRAGERS